MTALPTLPCREDTRREDSRQAALLGIDYVEVDPTQTVLTLVFLGRAPETLAAAQIVVTGGAPVAVLGVKVMRQKDRTLDDSAEIRVDRPGDFSIYTLTILGPDGGPPAGFDPRYASTSFSFKASCPTDLDCLREPLCPPVVRSAPAIDYLAKDYASFRQLILDRMAVTLPGWQESHVPDIGVMLVELLAYVGDQLSYYQDAVATEAYLGTARHRISLRRHARLVDYAMHEGCNARAFVQIETSADTELDPGSFFFSTAIAGTDPGIAPLSAFAASTAVGFEPLHPGPSQPLPLRVAHNAIAFYTWGERDCCLPKGTTSATLRDTWVTAVDPTPASGDGGDTPSQPSDTPEPAPRAVKTGAGDDTEATDGTPPGRLLAIKPGDLLLLEEVRGAHTGDPADADPTHRWVVCVTEVTPRIDPLYEQDEGGVPLLDISWCAEDALPFPLCLSSCSDAPDCQWRDDIATARGNVLLVDQGITISGEPLGTVPTETSTDSCATDCLPPSSTRQPGPFSPPLAHGPLTWAEPLPACSCAAGLLAQDPREAMPEVTLSSAGDSGEAVWSPRPDLLESGADDRAFVVETGDQAIANLRFGDGINGMVPPAAASFAARYRIGKGPSGNVGAETIVQIVQTSAGAFGATLKPRNPLAASGGTAAETADEVRQFAPYAFRSQIERAITAADYAMLAADDQRRLEARAGLAPAIMAALPPWRTDGDTRRLWDEEPSAPSPLPDLCRLPFQRLQGARAKLEWTGSWYEARVALDPLGSDDPAAAPCAEVAAYLDAYRRIGHDLAVQPPIYVPVDLGLLVCIAPDRYRGAIEAALLGVLGPGCQSDGTPGLFHPDRLSFAATLHASTIIAAAQRVPGVTEVQLLRLARFVPGQPPPDGSERIAMDRQLGFGAFEIARLDNDPSQPGFGRITLIMRGGR